MAYPLERNMRATALLAGLVLIGGIGCVTPAVVDSARQRDYRAAQEQRLADLRIKADAGDLAAMTEAGQRLLMQYRQTGAVDRLRQPAPPDDAGRVYLERAAARDYAPAMFVLGEYLAGFGSGADRPPEQGARGLELLKRAAAKGCVLTIPAQYPYRAHPASTVAELYRYRAYKSIDPDGNDIWLARSILHCGYPDDPTPAFKPFTPEAAVQLMAMRILRARPGEQPVVSPGLTEAQILHARERAAFLRQAVARTEAAYPTPPDAHPR